MYYVAQLAPDFALFDNEDPPLKDMEENSIR